MLDKIRLLTIRFFKPVIKISKPGTLHLYLLLIIHLRINIFLLNLLVGSVILTSRKPSACNSNAVSHWYLAVEVGVHHLIESLKIGVRLLCLGSLVRSSPRFISLKVLRATDILISCYNSSIGMLAHGTHLGIPIIGLNHEIILSGYPKIYEGFLVFLSFVWKWHIDGELFIS